MSIETFKEQDDPSQDILCLNSESFFLLNILFNYSNLSSISFKLKGEFSASLRYSDHLFIINKCQILEYILNNII